MFLPRSVMRANFPKRTELSNGIVSAAQSPTFLSGPSDRVSIIAGLTIR
jgi:hypothetical protein